MLHKETRLTVVQFTNSLVYTNVITWLYWDFNVCAEGINLEGAKHCFACVHTLYYPGNFYVQTAFKTVNAMEVTSLNRQMHNPLMIRIVDSTLTSITMQSSEIY